VLRGWWYGHRGAVVRNDPADTVGRADDNEAVSGPAVNATPRDERAFAELVAPFRRELHVHCYRMLGSVTDAEDVMQEVLTAAWRGLDGFAGRSSIRTWLYRIATNRCLNAIRDGRRRRPPEPAPPFDPPEPSRLGEITWLQPYPDEWLAELADGGRGPAARYDDREAVELAFIVALQKLPPRQLAALLLCDVLGFPAAEAAAMLDTTPIAIKGSLQRARARLDRSPAMSGNDAGSAADRALAASFAQALTAGDIDGAIALLTDDAWLAMPPARHEYHGHAPIAAFLRASREWRGRRNLDFEPTGANGQPAFVSRLIAPNAAVHPAGVFVLTIRGDRISAITRFLDERVQAMFRPTRHAHPDDLRT